MADSSVVRSNYVQGLQNAARLVIQLNGALANLSSLYVGGGLSGTFDDKELAASSLTKHLSSGDVGTYTSNLNTISTALSTPIIQNMAKAAGSPV